MPNVGFILPVLVLLLVMASTVKTSSGGQYADWMRNSPHAYSLMVDNMVFPGTHDTGSYHRDFDFLRPVSSLTKEKWWYDFVVSNFTEPPKLPWNSGVNSGNLPDVIKNFTVTQPSAPVKQQLLDGVRFLDVRVARSADANDTTYYLVHEYAVSLLSSLLRDVGEFLEEHSGEVVLMLVTPKYNIQSDVDLMKYVEAYKTSSGKTLADLMFPKSSNSSVPGTFAQCGTIGQVVASGKPLLAVYAFRNIPHPLPLSTFFFWTESFFHDRFKGSHTPKEKQAFLVGELNRLYQKDKQGKLFQLAYTLTPPDQGSWDATNSSEFVRAVTGKYTLEELTTAMNPTLSDFVLTTLSPEHQDFINVISFDFYHEYRESITQVVTEMLKRRTSRSTSSALQVQPSLSQLPALLAHSMLVLVLTFGVFSTD